MSAEYHSLCIDRSKCNGHMACMRVCPTQAIRIREGTAVMLEDRCIDCGECITACHQGAIAARTNSFTDLSRFKHRVALPSPVLYGQFGREVSPGRIISALQRIGFDDVCDLTPYCEAVTAAIQAYLDEYKGPRPLISSFCPTVVRLVQVKYPDLAELVVPIESPMEIAARETKQRRARELRLKEGEIGAIYITPCPSKMAAIKHHPRKERSYLDGAVSMADIYAPLRSAISSQDAASDAEEKVAVSGIGLGWAVLGGQTKALRAENSLAVSGLGHISRVLEDVENGRLRDVEYVECHSCSEGCVSGSLAVDNPYFARSKILRLIDQYGEEPAVDRQSIHEQYRKKYFSLERPMMTTPLKPLDADVSKAIEKLKEKEQILADLPQIDCGCCGAPTCSAFAEDIVRGEAKPTDCIFNLEDKVRDLLEALSRFADKGPSHRD